MRMRKSYYCLIFLFLLYFNFCLTTHAFHQSNDYFSNDSIVQVESAKSSWEWSPITVISNDTNDRSIESDITVDRDGNIHIVWLDDAEYNGSSFDDDIFYKRWNRTSKSWTTTEVISTESDDYSYSPSIATDGFGNIHVTWYDESNYDGSGVDPDIFYKKWNSVTKSWGSTQVISENSNSDSLNPSLVADDSGNIHIVWTDAFEYESSGPDPDICYRRWNNEAKSWTSIEIISKDSDSRSYDPSVTADNSGNIHFIWHDDTIDYHASGDDSDVFYRMWNSVLSNWGDIELVSSESNTSTFNSDIAVDKEENIHICWRDSTDYNGAGTDTDIFYKSHIKNTNFWTVAQVISTESVSEDSDYPKIDIDSVGNVHIVWHDTVDYTSSGPDYDVLYKKWSKSNKAWTSAEVISEGNNNSERPSIFIDDADGIHITWEDFEFDTVSHHTIDVFHKNSIGIPDTPILDPITPNPSYTENITLNWDKVYGAVFYSIYRNKSTIISSTSGKTPIATTFTTNYLDTVNSNGTYYYAIVANNYVGTSALSNCEKISVILPINDLVPLTMLLFGLLGFGLGCLVFMLIQRIRS